MILTLCDLMFWCIYWLGMILCVMFVSWFNYFILLFVLWVVLCLLWFGCWQVCDVIRCYCILSFTRSFMLMCCGFASYCFDDELFVVVICDFDLIWWFIAFCFVWVIVCCFRLLYNYFSFVFLLDLCWVLLWWRFVAWFWWVDAVVSVWTVIPTWILVLICCVLTLFD